MLTHKQVISYYSNENVLNSIFSAASGREISASLPDGSHMSRPNILAYKRDIVELVKRGAMGFHGTVEHWSNPLRIRTGMKPAELNELRTGWDLILDIDSAVGLDAAKIAANHVCRTLRQYELEPSIKFSGNRGFHIGVSWNVFPTSVDYESTASQFPRLPQAISLYIKEKIKDELLNDLRKLKGSMKALVSEIGEQKGDLTPYMFVEVESNWGVRHLFRLPYSLNEKSGLVSLPITLGELDRFEPRFADPARAAKYEPQQFLSGGGDATGLLSDAVDWYAEREKKQIKKKPVIRKKTGEIAEERFPPCVKAILNGIPDGRKRSVLILANFLGNMNWPWEKIEARIREWNEKNPNPLPESYINGQLNWFRRATENGRSLLPPNCTNMAFYCSFGVCKPDAVCTGGTDQITIKNPVSYPLRRRIK